MDTSRLAGSKARERFADLLNEVSVRGDRVILERHGKTVAALIPVADLELLQALEDRFDVESAREALAEPEQRISWKALKERLGL